LSNAPPPPNHPVARGIYRALTILLGVVLGAIFLINLIWKKPPPSSLRSPAAQSDYGQIPNFTLRERSGKLLSLPDLKGKVWVADFIFTRCQGPCPLQTGRMAELQKEFQSSPGLRFVSFSVDPAFDTPEVLSKYADTYGADPARWYFLTGETEQVYQLVRHGFHLAIQQNEAGREKPEEAITHSVSFVLVDGNGSIRGYYEGTDADDMKRLRKDILSFQ
jgi:protein SCO1